MTVTLAEIEREVASRVGPYRRVVASGGATTPGSITSLALQSTIQLGGWEDMYALRRNVTVSGGTVTSFNADDRTRLVKEYDPATGTLHVDRAYTTAPAATEYVELHFLEPEGELRPAVLAGLRRCYFEDTSALTLAAAAAERDLTALASWITDPEQVYGVEWAAATPAVLPEPMAFFRAYRKSGAVWLQTSPDAYPRDLILTSRRPHSSYVNGAVSATGPTADTDALAVPLEYAAAFGHAEAWRLCRDRLATAAAEGKAVSQQEAAAEATRQMWAHYPRQPDRARSRYAFGRKWPSDEVVG